MTRRRVGCVLAFATLSFERQVRADERTEAIELVTPLASALSNGTADDFLSRIPEDVPERTQLSDNVRSLVAQAEVTCSIQLTRIDNGVARFDWLMHIRLRTSGSVLERRQGFVTIKIRDKKIVSIEPVSFFRPVTVR